MAPKEYTIKEFVFCFGVSVTIKRDEGIVNTFEEEPYTIKYARRDDTDPNFVLTEMEFDSLVERMKRELCTAGKIKKENVND